MITLREITPDDSAALFKLSEKVFSSAWSEKSFFNDSKNPDSKYVLAFSDGVLIGYASYLKVLDEAQITNVAVLKEFRRQRIATEMIEFLIEEAIAQRINFMSLEVRSQNIAAISLYKKFGFTEVGLRKKYYQKPEDDAILMELVFTQEDNNING